METSNDKKGSFFRRYRWLLAALLLVSGGGYYLYIQGNGNFDLADSFTRYRQFPAREGTTDSLSPDSLGDIPPVPLADTFLPDKGHPARTPDSFFGFALPVYDSLPPISAAEAVIDSAAFVDSLARLAGGKRGGLKDSLIPAPSPPVADDPVAPVSTPTSTKNITADIFDALLPSTYQSPAAKQTFLETYTSNTISTRGAYKLVAITGRAFLLHESPEVLELLNTFVEEEAIVAISVSDRQGRILYASNPRERGRLVGEVYAELSVSNEAINWMRTDGRTVTGIPVFSVGGRLGTVFVVTR